MSSEPEKNRWYLCVETKPANWSCEEHATKPIVHAGAAHTQIVIPVSASYPKWWDALHVSHELRPLVSFNFIKDKLSIEK
jgi:hypothetical protein